MPSYIDLYKSGEFKNRIATAEEVLKECVSCPRKCKVDRSAGQKGLCSSSQLPIVSSYLPHFGEEPVLSGTKGAGNIFFGNCNLKCVYCQNYDISQNPQIENGHEVQLERLAQIMIELQLKGCHNIGLVSPTHFSLQILKAIYLAVEMGLHIPIIYNSNGYDSVEVLQLFDGIIDIYLPDLKYGCNEYGESYSGVPNYFDYAKEALKEMYKQVGAKLEYENDVLSKGMIIRHLILPNGLAETENVFKFIAEELNPQIHISLMSQYYPANKAYEAPLLSRTISISEYNRAIELMGKYGLINGWQQDLDSNMNYRPNFKMDRTNPFK